MAYQEPEHVGLLFVHGIGEQERFEHLRAATKEFAELMKQCDQVEGFACTVQDRTADWKLPPGTPDPTGLAPVTLTLQNAGSHIQYHCHEVWWADLAARRGLADAIAFWIWGFGQWGAPIYRQLDAAGLEKSDENGTYNKAASRLVKMPEAVAGRLGPECVARLRLAGASLATVFVALSWVVLKRIFSAALQQAPSPTLLVSYVGDVRTYESRAAPGESALIDPGHPRRVGIRRRMVSEMVAMGARRDLSRWYVVAHSQGTVLAYNGLTEIGHTLPNYLSEDQWNGLPGHLKRDPGCRLRPLGETSEMMPARPAWLHHEDLIDRPELFAKLRGFLTYGSPLNKFAAIWPRVVATATDRAEGDLRKPFSADCRWVNLRAPQDPVAGDVRRFFGPKPERPGLEASIPKIVDVPAPLGIDFLLAHIRYFAPKERFGQSKVTKQRHALMRWLMTSQADLANGAIETLQEREPGRIEPRALLAGIGYLLLIILFGVLATVALTLGSDLVAALFGDAEHHHYDDATDFLRAARLNVPMVLTVAMSLIAAAGYFRWFRECWLNARLAAVDKSAALIEACKAEKAGLKEAAGVSRTKADSLRPVIRLLRLQVCASVATIVFWAAGIWWFYRADMPSWTLQTAMPPALAVASGMLLSAVFIQSLVNLGAKPLRYKVEG